MELNDPENVLKIDDVQFARDRTKRPDKPTKQSVLIEEPVSTTLGSKEMTMKNIRQQRRLVQYPSGKTPFFCYTK